MTPIDRAIQFKVMLSDEERRMVEELAASSGLSASDVVRSLIRKEHRTLVSATCSAFTARDGTRCAAAPEPGDPRGRCAKHIAKDETKARDKR